MSRRIFGWGRIAAALVATMLFLAACGGDDSDNTSEPTGEDKVGAEIESVKWILPVTTIRSLDVIHSYDLPSVEVAVNYLEGLLAFDNDGKLKPNLAKSWSQPDPLTFVYELRDDVTFWDGSPMTAEDAAFSIARNLDPNEGSEAATYFAAIKSAEATGPYQVTMKLSRPDPLAQYVPASAGAYVVSKKFAEANGGKFGDPKTLTMGTGPYKVTRFSPDSGVGLARNDAYWGTKGRAKAVDLQFVADPSAALLAVKGGDADGIFGIPVATLDQWRSLGGVSVKSTEGTGQSMMMIVFDTAAKPWSDVHVRRAVAYSLDAKGLVKAALHDFGEPATSLVAPIAWSGLDLSDKEVGDLYDDLPEYGLDEAKAKAELAQSSTPNGFEATFDYPQGSPAAEQVAVNLSTQLARIGIKLKVNPVAPDAYGAKLYAHQDLGIQLLVITPDFPDPSNSLDILLHSKYAQPNNFNFASYKNPEMDALLEQQANATDAAARVEPLRKAMELAARDLPYLPVWWQGAYIAAHSDKVRFDFSSDNAYAALQGWMTRISAAG